MTRPRKHTPEQAAEAERVLDLIRPEGEGWETALVDGHILWRRPKSGGRYEYANPQWDEPREQA